MVTVSDLRRVRLWPEPGQGKEGLCSQLCATCNLGCRARQSKEFWFQGMLTLDPTSVHFRSPCCSCWNQDAVRLKMWGQGRYWALTVEQPGSHRYKCIKMIVRLQPSMLDEGALIKLLSATCQVLCQAWENNCEEDRPSPALLGFSLEWQIGQLKI